MLSNLIRTIWVKIQMKKKILFLWVMLGPYIKSRGTGGTNLSANGDLITVETYVQGKTIESQFLIYGIKCTKYIFFWLFDGPWGYSNFWFCLSCSPAILSSIYICMWEIRKQSEQIFLVQFQNIKIFLLSYLEGSRVTKFSGQYDLIK